MIIEELIEEAMVDIMQARTYISTNSIPVVRFRDRLTAKGNRFITVHANPNQRISNNHNLYTVRLELLADTKVQEDVKAVNLDALISECQDEIQQTLTPATLQAKIDAIQAASGLTIAGFDPQQGDDTDEEYQIVRSVTDVSLIFIKP